MLLQSEMEFCAVGGSVDPNGGRRHEQREGMASNYGNLGIISQKRGDLDEAGNLWTKARDLYARMGMPHMVEQMQGWLDSLPGAGG